jgi:hypothetical protein
VFNPNSRKIFITPPSEEGVFLLVDTFHFNNGILKYALLVGMVSAELNDISSVIVNKRSDVMSYFIEFLRTLFPDSTSAATSIIITVCFLDV